MKPKRYYNLLVSLVLPGLFVTAQLYIRSYAGAYWHWYLLDPSYFYLLDGLNILNGNTPGHVYHPGVTVHALNASLIWLSGIFQSDSHEILVLTNPERYLDLFSNVAIFLNALSLWVLGLIGRKAFGEWLPAIACQLAPFMSSIVLKHAFLPKPEALLVFSTCLLIALTLCNRRNRPLIENHAVLAISFGILGGFILATKITAGPILVLALISLRGTQTKLIFICATMLAFFFFFLPAIGAIDEFFEWLMLVSSRTGAHGGGAQGLIIIEEYSAAFIKILKRPSIRVPLILSIISLTITGWRLKYGYPIKIDDARILAGISAAQIAQVALVAKQATAFYMIPSYMLASLSVLFSVRLLWHAKPIEWRTPLSGRSLGIILIIGFVIAQISGVGKLANHFATLRQNAAKVDNTAFTKCARIYNYSASSPAFAMFLADYNTGLRFSKILKNHFSENDYWIEDWWSWQSVNLRNWDGDSDI